MMQERPQRNPNLVVLVLALIGLAMGLALGGCTATPLPLPMNELGPAADAGASLDAPQTGQDAAADMGAYPDAPAPKMDALADLTTADGKLGDAEAGTDAKGEGGLSDLSAAETTVGD